MKTLFAVTRTRGPGWDASKPLRSQEQWIEHASFMDQLAADGFVVLGGPLGDDGKVLLVIDASDENEIHPRLAEDPWSPANILEVSSIQRWTILLEAAKRA